jgi:hypothetical protein
VEDQFCLHSWPHLFFLSSSQQVTYLRDVTIRSKWQKLTMTFGSWTNFTLTCNFLKLFVKIQLYIFVIFVIMVVYITVSSPLHQVLTHITHPPLT